MQLNDIVHDFLDLSHRAVQAVQETNLENERANREAARTQHQVNQAISQIAQKRFSCADSVA
jgi:hypothetical protein